VLALKIERSDRKISNPLLHRYRQDGEGVTDMKANETPDIYARHTFRQKDLDGHDKKI
jgi:hypothetical protein